MPEVGDYHALPQEGEGRALVRTAQGVELISNVCRHRQALMLRGRGHTGSNVVCPLHRWTYDTHGQLLGAPHFADDPCLNLRNYPVQNWNGLLFEGGGRDVNADLARLGPKADMDFSGYVFDSVHLHECDYNWKTFIEVYLEDYHVGPFHPGLGNFVTCDDLRWELGAQHSVQTVGANNALAKAGSATYRKWHDAVLAYRNGVPPKHGAIWLTYYPTVMVEWYPHVLVVSTLHPIRGRQDAQHGRVLLPGRDRRVRARVRRGRSRPPTWRPASRTTRSALRMDAGRRALMERGDDEVGPYQSPMEDGMQHFHEWYRAHDGRPGGGSRSSAMNGGLRPRRRQSRHAAPC